MASKKDMHPQGSCDLCLLYEKRQIITKLRFEDEQIIIVDCIMCSVPMVVAKRHDIPVPADLEHWMESKLTEIANAVLGPEAYYVDKYERMIPDHRHFHARRKGWW